MGLGQGQCPRPVERTIAKAEGPTVENDGFQARAGPLASQAACCFWEGDLRIALAHGSDVS